MKKLLIMLITLITLFSVSFAIIEVKPMQVNTSSQGGGAAYAPIPGPGVYAEPEMVDDLLATGPEEEKDVPATTQTNTSPQTAQVTQSTTTNITTPAALPQTGVGY